MISYFSTHVSSLASNSFMLSASLWQKNGIAARLTAICALIAAITGISTTSTKAQNLSDYFGFSSLEVVKIDKYAGPIALGDLNSDGLMDLIVINNYKSRIEIHYQKKNPSPDDADTSNLRTNEFPEHWRFRREFVTVSHRVGAIVAYDYDKDGLIDLVYTGIPQELVLLRQIEPGNFKMDRRERIKGLQASKDSLHVGNVMGDDAPEILTIASGKIEIWSYKNGLLKKEETLAAGAPLIALWHEDFNGDGITDIAGVIPDDRAPLRMWLGEDDGGKHIIGPQLRFEMPPLIECEVVRLPDAKAAQIAVLERPSKRLVVYSVTSEQVESTGTRNASLRIHAFTDPESKERDVTIADVNGDGLVDLISTDINASTVVVYFQNKGKGLQRGESYPSLANITALASTNIDDDPFAELFVLSERESIAGRSEFDGKSLEFPMPVNIPDGKTPVAMNIVYIQEEPILAVALKDGRKYSLSLIKMSGEAEEIDLGSASRSPDSVVGLDADRNGMTDLLLFTRDKPMTMLYQNDEGFELLESKDMGQFGLVQAATSENTAVFDIDDDGLAELLIADRNYIRAVRFDPNPPAGVSPGWQVVKQLNADRPDSKLVAIAVSEGRLYAADKANDRIVIFSTDTTDWSHNESLLTEGFEFNELFAGSFAGDEEESLLAIGDEGFAVIKLAGERVALKETNSWRTDDERRQQHELIAGDVNADGFTDLVSLDAGEQMLEIFTFTESGHMLYATGFQVFESRLFTRGDAREYEPSQCLIGDVTGDDANDIILLTHDRVLIYPQMTIQSHGD